MAVITAAHEAPVARRTRVPLPPSLRRPGWYRAALFEVMGFAFAFGLTVLIRALMHEHPVIDGHAITIVALIAVPLFFLFGSFGFVRRGKNGIQPRQPQPLVEREHD